MFTSLIFGQSNFIIPSMIAIIGVLSFMRNKLEGDAAK